MWRLKCYLRSAWRWLTGYRPKPLSKEAQRFLDTKIIGYDLGSEIHDMPIPGYGLSLKKPVMEWGNYESVDRAQGHHIDGIVPPRSFYRRALKNSWKIVDSKQIPKNVTLKTLHVSFDAVPNKRYIIETSESGRIHMKVIDREKEWQEFWNKPLDITPEEAGKQLGELLNSLEQGKEI